MSLQINELPDNAMNEETPELQAAGIPANSTRIGGLTPAPDSDGLLLPVDGIDENLPQEPNDALQLNVDNLLAASDERVPLLHVKPNGHIGLNRAPDPDEDFTPAAKEIYGDDWLGMVRFIASAPEEQQAERRRFILGEMDAARKMQGGELPGFQAALPQLAKEAGMTEEEYQHWQKRNPKLIANQITDRQILRLSGDEGYTTGLARNPTRQEMKRADMALFAQAEAYRIEQRGDFIDQSLYDLRSGFGQVGAFAVGGMAGIARLASDAAEWEYGGASAGARDAWRFAADWWHETALDAEAGWIGPTLDTGNSWLDYGRTAVFRGLPFMAGSAALAAIPGVGSAGAAGIIAAGMGGETYGTLRADGVSPGLSLAAGAVTGISSYFSTKFQLDNLTRYFGGRAPLRLWSVGTGLEVLGEAGQEAVENITQTGAESVARLLGDPDYDSIKFWNDLKTGFLGSLDEGMSAGITTAAMRIFGFPIAARNQMRASTFAKAFTKSAESVGKTEMYAEQPEVLAEQLTNMAWQHGDGRVYTTVETLNQSGVTREQAIASVAEDGLGVNAAAYDEAGRTEGTLAIGYGEAMVFGQKQAEAGNKAAFSAFSVAPDAMSVGDIARQRAETEAIITQSEVYYQEEVKGDSPKTPLRIKVFKAGLRAAGFDTYQAAALTAMYRVGAERNAELAGETVEEWLKRKNVRLEFERTLLGTGRREATDYAKLLEELDGEEVADGESVGDSTESVIESDETVVEAAQSEIEPVGGVSNTEPVLEQSAAADIEESTPDTGIFIQPVESEADDAAWEEEAIQNVTDSLDVTEEEKPAVAEAVKQVIEATRPLFAAAELAPPENAAAQSNPNAGVETEIIFPAETKQQPLSVHYELVEADSLQPSHTPRDFRPNDAWAGSALAQQRNYDSASMAPIRASIQTDRLNFPSMFNPTTDAVNGPPVVTPDGMVLGGNNRTLRILNRYEQDSYRTMLEAHLSSRRNMFGIRPEAVRGMNRPVLVRVVDAVAETDIPRLIGALNADFTTRRDAGNLAANRGLSVGTNTMNAFKSIGDRTVSAFLDDPNMGYRAITAMRADGVFQDTDLVGIYDFQNSKWLPGGKAQVEQALFGAVLPDSRLLDEMTPAMQRKLLKALPALVRLKASGSSELATLFQAISWHNEYQEFKETAIGKQFKSEPARLEAFRKPDMADMFTGELQAEKGGAAWDMLLDIQKAKSQKEVAEFFARKADELSGTGRGLFSLQQGAIETLYQPTSLSGNWGSIAFPATEGDPTIINLLKGANVSTVVHELNHLFLNDLVGLVKAGKGGDVARRHFDTLNSFADGNLMSDDPGKRRDAYEKIARAWEYYAMNAEAPAPALEEPFATIRKYMAAVYRNAKESPLVEPSPEVRNVFDRMLATDREIEDAARIREVNADWTKAGNVSEGIQKRMDANNARRDERRRKKRDAQQGAGRAMRNESRLDAARRVMREKASQEPVYRAIDLAKAMGGMRREEAVSLAGEKAVKDIAEKHGKLVFNDAEDIFGDAENPVVSAERVAASAGFADPASMLSAMLEAESLDVKAERDARSEQDMDDLAEDIEREALDEAEGEDTDDADADSGKAPEAGQTPGDEEETAAERDMLEEVDLAIENEYAGDGRLFVPPVREKSVALREFHNEAAGIKRAAYAKVFAMSNREGADTRGFQSARKNVQRKAFTAQAQGRKDKVTAFKKQELFHFYEIQAAKKARTLRMHIASEYSAGGLRSIINAIAPETEKLRDLIKTGYHDEQLRVAMNAAEHNAKVEYEYARKLAEIALYAGFGDSRFLRELAGDLKNEKTLTLPSESEEVAGVVDGIADTLDPWLAAKEKPENFRDFRDFTTDQLVELDRVMKWLIDNGRGKLAYLQDADIKNLKDLTQKSIEPMLRRKDRKAKLDNDDRTTKGRALNRIKKFVIGMTIPENWFMAMDGNPTIQGKAAGVNHRLLFEVMDNADAKKGILYSDVVAKMKPAFDALEEMKARLDKAFGGKLFAIPGLPVPEVLKRGRNVSSWDADLLISIALQMGNDANLRRLLSDAEFEMRFKVKVEAENQTDRYNFTNAQLATIAGLFTDAEWDAIQSIWDASDTLYTQADAVTFTLTNRHVRKEEAKALMVQTADGKIKSLRGGYFPLVSDPMLSDRAEKQREGQAVEEYIRSGIIGNVNGSSKQNVGALKSRARDEKGVPMSTIPQMLSTKVLTQHIDAMAHYITHALPLRDIDRLTRSDEWKRVYVDKFGQEQYDAIRKWVKNLAMPERGDASVGGRFMEHLRSLATVNALGLRWKTGIKQRLGAFQAAAYMGDAAGDYFTGWKYLVQGVNEMGVRGNIGLHTEKIDAVNAKSEFMAARSGGFDREVRAMQSKLSPLDNKILGRSLGDWQNMAFFWIQANDQAMAYSVWLGAYKQARAGEAGFKLDAAEGETEADTEARIEREAVAFADRAARTQASSFAADLTENQRDRGFMRFMSMFMSGNVRQGSRLMQYLDAYRMGDKTKGDVAMLAAREFAFPALAWVFMAAAVKSALSAALGMDDDDDDNLLANAVWETIGSAVAPFPLLREVPRIMQYGTMGGDVTAVKNAALAANNLFGIPGRLAEAKYMQAVGQAMRSASYATGIPLINPLDDTGISAALGLKK